MRFPLLLALFCTVQAISRVKRATTGGSGNAATAANTTGAAVSNGPVSPVHPAGSPVGSTAATASNDARRAFEYKEKPKNLQVRQNAKQRETSSSSGERIEKGSGGKSAGNKDSLELSDEPESSDTSGKAKQYRPKSSAERTGWKKWHRKCTPCPEEMLMKWRDPRIKWVCGAYQRARRSFKSLCLMRYRNCQDGTMFVYIHDHRCANSTPDDSAPHGEHFMYDYKARLSDDSSSSNTESSSESNEPESSKASS
ncbi:hypothetical protein O0L34_g3261 [Tuta absoluta]|nr:hypothetical protein O0L34_g3261 [Tuta absoluta]